MKRLMLTALVATGADLPHLDATRLQPGEACYTIIRGGTTIGATWQAVRASVTAGRPTWDIVVHQRHSDGGFDMRDHFVLDRTSLLPLTMDSQRGSDRSAKGWHRVALRYDGARVTGRKETASGTTPVAVPLSGSTWDGNLWGLTFAALPLRVGGHYTLPTWQYDKGAGSFTIVVAGAETIDTPAGNTAAWALDAGDDPAHLVRYYVAQKRPMELGYRAGPFEQKLGGDCTGMGETPRRQP